MVKKKPTKKNNGKLLVKKTKRKSFRKAGANTPSPIRRANTPSPIRRLKRTLKAIRIQRVLREHTERKPAYIKRESDNFKSLIGQRALKYKNEIKKLNTRGLNLTSEKLSAKPL